MADMLWLCLHLPQWSLEAFAPTERPAVAIVHERNRRRIVGCNRAAEQSGLSTATSLTVALALEPRLQVLERNARTERQALERLAAWAYQWSSQITWREAQPKLADYTAALWIEIGASRTLFGGYAQLLCRFETALRDLQYTYRLGVAPTPEGAELLARAGRRVLATTPERLRTQLGELPIDHLAVSAEVTYALQRSGITRIDALLDLPAAAIARRFGPDLNSYLCRLCGIAPDLRPRYRPPKRYRARSEFGSGVDNIEALLFPLQRMLQEFCGYLCAIDRAAQRYSIIFEHERRAGTRIEMNLATPSRDATRLLALARERLHDFMLPDDAYGLSIAAHEFAEPVVRQRSLFAGEAEIADELRQTLETLAARLGTQAMLSLHTVADHRPEHAWTFSAAKPAAQLSADRPLWILPKPRRLKTRPPVATQPERIEAGWWTAPCRRDYYRVRSQSGTGCWVFLDRDDGYWYLHGYWA